MILNKISYGEKTKHKLTLLFDFHLIEKIQLAFFDIVLTLSKLLIEELTQTIEEYNEIRSSRPSDHKMYLIPRDIEFHESFRQPFKKTKNTLYK